MATIKKSLRIEEAIAERVTALKAEGESEAAAYSRVISAGLDAMEGQQEQEQEQPQAADATAQADRIADLKDQIDTLKGIIAKKDEQLEQANRLLDQGQKVQALALAQPKKSLPQRIKEFFTGSDKSSL